MDNEKIVSVVMVSTVAIILVGVLLVPIINDAMDGDQVTFSNGNSYVEFVEEGTISISATGATLDGDDLTASKSFYAIGDCFGIIYSNGVYFAYQGGGYNGVTGTDVYTVTVSNGSAVINDGSSDVATVDCSGFYVASATKTDTVIVSNGDQSYFTDISDIYTIHVSGGAFYHLEDGTLTKEGVETAYTVVSGISDVSGYEDLKSRNTSLVVNLTGTNTNVTLSYSYVVPAEVVATVEGSVYDLGLLTIIPVLVIVALIVGMIAYIKKD